jgi:hypothetical protein
MKAKSILQLLVPMGMLALGCDGDDRGSSDGGTFGTHGGTDTGIDTVAGPMNDTMPSYDCETGGDTDDCETSGGVATAGDSTTGGADGTTGPVDECAMSSECGEGRCVAEVELVEGGDQPSLMRGAFTCSFTCVPELDDAQWCSDDAACCDDGARCTDRGYCVIE